MSLLSVGSISLDSTFKMHHATRHALLQYVTHCCKIAGRRKLLCWMDGAGYRIIISGDNHVCMGGRGGRGVPTRRLDCSEERRESWSLHILQMLQKLSWPQVCKSPPHSFIGTYFILFFLVFSFSLSHLFLYLCSTPHGLNPNFYPWSKNSKDWPQFFATR
jgi:hypothetical protein